uniref:BSD domain-containing protein n=1 Tax=Candolleomyces aberdarensis TaxID=2316362 RepID=A0A4Q2DRT4_9AGAR
MNFFDTYDIARGPTPQPSDENQPSLNEEVTQVIGQLGRFWGGFKKQSQQAYEVARKDLGDVVVQAQKEIGKYTAPEAQPGSTGDGAQDQATTSRSVDAPSADGSSAEPKDADSNTASTAVATAEGLEPPTNDGPSASTSSQASSSSSSLFSRLQSAIPPNLITTVQSAIPESIKHASENIDVSQISSNVLSELQRVQGVTRAQAEEYARKSEALIREAVKEANEVLKDAVKIIPPDLSTSSSSGQAAGSGLVWDGSDMWMLPMDLTPNQASSSSSSPSATGKERAGGGAQSSESQHAVASRALALLHRLQSDPSIIQHDPEADDNVKEAYAKWREEEVKAKGGFESPEWAEKTGNLLKEVTPLYEIYSSLVPSTLSREEFWSRYFFRAHQIKHEEERRKALIQATVTESDEDFSWEDDDDEHETAASQPAAVAQSAEKDKGKLTVEPTLIKSEPSPSPRVSMGSADSFDVVSSTNASVVIEGKEPAKPQPVQAATKAAVAAAVAAPVAAAAAVAAAANDDEEEDEDEEDEEEEEEDDEEEESEDSDWE